MDSEVRIVVVQLPSLSPGGRTWGRTSPLGSGSRETLKTVLEEAMNSLEPTNMADVQYRTYLGNLETEGLSGSRAINPLAAVDKNQSIRPAPTPGDVLMLELGDFSAGSIMRTIA